MLQTFLNTCLRLYIAISLILFASSAYAYRVNARRASDDPQKRDYHPLAVFLFPIWPLWLFFWLALFLLRALVYGLFLVLFTVGLIVFHKPPKIAWLERLALNIGNKLLQMNMLIVRLFLPQPASQTV
jgi:hypothetical protein